MHKKIRILHIITGLKTGGAESMLYKITTNMDTKRFENIILSLMDLGKYGHKLMEKGIEVYTLNMKKNLKSIFSLFNLIKIMKECKPDVIQTWMYHANIVGILLKLFYKIPLVWNIRHTIHSISHERWLTRLIILFGGILSKYPNYIIYNSEKSLKSHLNYRYQKEKSLVIGNGFNTEEFKPLEESKLHKELSLLKDDIVIGMVARYHPIKDHKTFVKAAKILCQSRKNVYFVLVGRDVNTDNEELMNLINSFQLSNRFFLLGERSDIPNIMASFTIATLSSVSESFPNVIGEAMSCGIPCVSTDVGGVREILGDTGVVVPVGDPKALSRAWEKMISIGEQQRKHLGMKARKRIVEHFSLKKIVDCYQNIYLDLYKKGVDN